MELAEYIAFMARVDDSGECWLWLGHKTRGYGKFFQTGKKPRTAHRLAYEHFVGPIPAGLTIDHLCRNRGCVNPDHLEPVTMRENMLRGEGPGATNARKTHCPRGHEYTPENTYRYSMQGGRRCRICHNAEARRRYKRKPVT